MKKSELLAILIVTILFFFAYKPLSKIGFNMSSKGLVEETIKEKVKSECLK